MVRNNIERRRILTKSAGGLKTSEELIEESPKDLAKISNEDGRL
jgi:hypothetical protein